MSHEPSQRLHSLAGGALLCVYVLNSESTAAKVIHIIGDEIQLTQGMPQSGQVANARAKAAAIVAGRQGLEPGRPRCQKQRADRLT